MKIFIDSANIGEIREAVSWGIIDGVTTNPSLMAKEEGKSFKEMAEEILSLVDGPISLEAVSVDAEGMIKEANELAKIHKNVAVKIPMTTEGLKAVKQLNSGGIKTNVTLVFTANQALLAAKAGATFVSPFVGRLDDINEDGMKLVEETMEIFSRYPFKTEVIVASVRNTGHVLRAAKCGAHIATAPFKVLKELAKHELTDKGIKKFLEDWEKVKKR